MALVYFKGVGLVDAASLVCGELILPPEALAHGLASRTRFSGQTDEPYDVLRHSLAVSRTARMVSIDLLGINEVSSRRDRVLVEMCALWGLLHDATEVVLADVAAPIKRVALMSPYAAVEGQLSEAYQKHYIPSLWDPGMPGADEDRIFVNEAVHRADIIRLNIEAIALLPSGVARHIQDTTCAGKVTMSRLLSEVAESAKARHTGPMLQDCFTGDPVQAFCYRLYRLKAKIERMERSDD